MLIISYSMMQKYYIVMNNLMDYLKVKSEFGKKIFNILGKVVLNI